MSSARERLIELAERRTRLQARAQAEREALASTIEHVDQVAGLVQRLRVIVDEVRSRPWIVGGGVALLFALKPRRALGWLAKGWSAWRMYRGAERWWRQSFGRDAGAA
jgi:hypothetical protein